MFNWLKKLFYKEKSHVLESRLFKTTSEGLKLYDNGEWTDAKPSDVKVGDRII